MLESGTGILPVSGSGDETHSQDGRATFTDAEMMTAVERVASHGFVRLLKTSDGQQRILLGRSC